MCGPNTCPKKYSCKARLSGGTFAGRVLRAACPNCKIAKEILKGEDYQIIDAEENQDLVRKYGIMQAPTLVVTDGTKAKKYVNASNIKKYVADVKQTV